MHRSAESGLCSLSAERRKVGRRFNKWRRAGTRQHLCVSVYIWVCVCVCGSHDGILLWSGLWDDPQSGNRRGSPGDPLMELSQVANVKWRRDATCIISIVASPDTTRLQFFNLHAICHIFVKCPFSLFQFLFMVETGSCSVSGQQDAGANPVGVALLWPPDPVWESLPLSQPSNFFQGERANLPEYLLLSAVQASVPLPLLHPHSLPLSSRLSLWCENTIRGASSWSWGWECWF